MKRVKDLYLTKNGQFVKKALNFETIQKKPTTSTHLCDLSQRRLKRHNLNETSPSVFSQETTKRIDNFSVPRSFYQSSNHNKSRSVKRARGEVDSNPKSLNELQGLLKTTTLENIKLKRLNKELVIDKYNNKEIASTIHSFYQNIVLPENNESIEEMQKVIDELKEKITDLVVENTQLKKNIKKYKSIINRYRDIVTSSKSRNADKEVMNKTFIVKQPVQVNEQSTLNTQNVFLDMLCGTLQRISNANSASKLISTLYKEIKVLLKLHKIGIFIIDPSLKKLFQKEKGYVQTINVGKKRIDLALPDKTSYLIKPAITPYEVGNNSVRNNKVIVLPITGSKSKLESGLYLMIQLENPLPSKGTHIDEKWVIVIDY